MADTSEYLRYPPLDGSLLFPEFLTFNAQHNPNIPFFVFPKDSTTNATVTISHLEFYRACHRVAHTLRPNRKGPEGEVVAIIANTDTIQYYALLVGAVIAGYIPFPMSPRNSSAAVINMLRNTSCHRLIATYHSLRSNVDSIRSELGSYDLFIQEAPNLAQAYPKLGSETAEDAFEPFPERATRPTLNDVMLYLHSSGSTGFPKAIPQTYQNVLHWCSTPAAADLRKFPSDTRAGTMSLPAFHTLGIVTSLYAPIVSLRSVAVYAPTSFDDPNASPVIPTSENIIDCVKRTGANVLLVVPAFIEQWASIPAVVELMKTFRYIAYSGGPLSEKLGDALVSQGISIKNMYGGTEFGPPTALIRPPGEEQDWAWIRFSPRAKFRWVPSEEGAYECQILSSETHQVSVENLPDVKGYATSDLFIKHPTKEGLWKLVGRADDVIVLASGEKTVPLPMETIIASNPMVGGTAMFGRARNQVGIIIEPRENFSIDVDDEKQLAEFRNKIWPEVEEANKTSPAFSRIFKEMILVTRSDKPFPRAAKGTVMKKAAVKLYEKEINALYEAVEASTKAGNDVELPKSWSEEVLIEWLSSHATIVNSDKSVDPDVDFFEQGFDSLSATFLKNRIIGSLNSSPDANIRAAASRIDQNIVFNNPTIQRLAKVIARVVSNPESVGEGSKVDHKEEIENMIAKYSEGLPETSDSQTTQYMTNGHGHHAVLLTGSTGGLGSYLLASLLDNEHVDVVYVFNRPAKNGRTSEERQKAAFEDRGLDVALLGSQKLRYLEGDASQEKLGLEESLYDELRTSATVIIHNAWRLDFNLSLSSFEPNIKGTRNLMDLALSSPHSSTVRFLFTSSISSAQGWDQTRGAFPEEVQFDASVASGGSGYGASKYVCERLLEKSGLQASSFRIGQVSGGTPRGAWSVTDWIPIIVKSSLSLGALPIAKGLVAWLPPHAVSNAILDVAFAVTKPPMAINLVHPRPVEWETLMRPIGGALAQKELSTAPLPFVPFNEWLARLEHSASSASADELEKMPAIKLLAFMRMLALGDEYVRKLGRDDVEATGLTVFSTTKAQAVSQTMKELVPLTPEDAELWVDYWEAVGMFA